MHGCFHFNIHLEAMRVFFTHDWQKEMVALARSIALAVAHVAFSLDQVGTNG